MSEDWSEVPMIPVFPNWNQPVSERYEFRTTVFEAHSGDEQRRALRQRPRRSIQYLGSASGETLRELSALLTLRRDTRVKVPDTTRSEVSTFVNETTIQFPSGNPGWLAAGDYVFMQEGLREEVARVLDVDGVVTFEEELLFDYQNPRVYPARLCRFPPEQKLSYLTNMVAQGTFVLEIDPGTEADEATSEPTQFRGQDTMFLKPNWRDGVPVTFGIPGDIIDYGVGRIAIDYRQTLNTKIVELSFLGRSRDEVRKHLNQFYRAKGRRGVFYIPTWTSDFEMVGPVDYGTNSITVRGIYRQDLDPFDFSHRNIALIWGDTVIPCGIYSATVVAEGLKLRIDRNLAELPLPERFFLSWLVMARYASDEMAVDWRTDTVAEVSYKVAVMRDSFFELAIGGHRVVFYGDYVLMGDT